VGAVGVVLDPPVADEDLSLEEVSNCSMANSSSRMRLA
jgi:hypothetical protein